MPNAWNAGWSLVSPMRKLESHLSSSKPTAPSSAPAHSDRCGSRGRTSSVKMAKKSSMSAAPPRTTTEQPPARAPVPGRGPAGRGAPSEKPATSPEMATLTIRITPMTASVTRSRSLPTTKLGWRAVGSSKTWFSASRMHESPAEAGVEEHDEADHADRARRRRWTASSEIWSGPSPISPGSTRLERRDQVVLGVGEDLRDVADDEERERQDREERQEGEVGHRAGLVAALDAAVVLLRADGVVEQARSRPSPVEERGDPLLQRRPSGQSSPVPAAARSRGSAASPRRRRGRRGGSSSTSKAHSKSGQLVEGLVQLVVGEVVGDGDVRVVGELEVDVERPAAHGVGQLLALRDALDQADEHHRRDRPEGAGAAQVHANAATSPRPPRRGAPRPRPASSSSTSVGGTSVMWVGISAAVGSPRPVR